MATAILTPLTFAASPTSQGSPIADFMGASFTPTGDPDGGRCVQDPDDGLSDDRDYDGDSGYQFQIAVYWEDDGSIPMGATINSVQLKVRARNVVNSGDPSSLQILALYNANDGSGFPAVNDPFVPTDSYDDYPVGPVLTENDVTAAPWARADLFNDGDAGGFGNGTWFLIWTPAASVAGNNSFSLDEVFLEVDYVGGGITGVRMDQCPVLVVLPFHLAQSNALGVNLGSNIEIEAANVLVPALEAAGVDPVITPEGGTPGQGGPFPVDALPGGPNPAPWTVGVVAAPPPALPNTSVPKQWQLLRFDIKPRAEERA